MEIAILILTFLAWAVAFWFCVFITLHGIALVTSSRADSTPIRMTVSSGRMQFSLRTGAGIAIALAGIAGVIFVTYSYWYVLLMLLAMLTPALISPMGGGSGSGTQEADKDSENVNNKR